MLKCEILNKLENDLTWLSRGVLAIDARQTSDEQASRNTKYENGRGWNKSDASYGGYVAKYLRSGRMLSGHHIGKVRKMMIKYAGQLARIVAASKGPQVTVIQPTIHVPPVAALNYIPPMNLEQYVPDEFVSEFVC